MVWYFIQHCFSHDLVIHRIHDTAQIAKKYFIDIKKLLIC